MPEVSQTAEAEQPTVAEPSEGRRKYADKAEALSEVEALAQAEECPAREEVEQLKTVFYKLLTAERDADYQQYIAGGGNPDTYAPLPDETEERFKTAMNAIKERRQQQFRDQEAERETNLKRKLEILDQIKAMVTSPEEANDNYKQFQALQQEWKEIRNIPATEISGLWRTYQLYVEQFYDLIKLNSEAREYDFKKNLEVKERLIGEIEALANVADTIAAYRAMQPLQQEFRETGPVGRDLRDQIWKRFKDAVTVINKRHQQHFEEIRAREEDNLAKKTALCERVEALVAKKCATAKEWDETTKQIIDSQAEWKTVGFAPQKMNVQIFERFRGVCDGFFAAKNEYFKQLKADRQTSVERRRELVARAKELKDSKDWRQTTPLFVQLQKDWKASGSVPKKIGDELWAEFNGYCNEYFDAKNAATSGTREQEKANLARKRDILARMAALAPEEGKDLQAELTALVREFESAGRVPFAEKDKLRAEYMDLISKFRTQYNINVNVQRRQKGGPAVRVTDTSDYSNDQLRGERLRLERDLNGLTNDIKNYENNLGFLSLSSKKANSLVDDIRRKLEALKERKTRLTAELKDLNARIK